MGETTSARHRRPTWDSATRYAVRRYLTEMQGLERPLRRPVPAPAPRISWWEYDLTAWRTKREWMRRKAAAAAARAAAWQDPQETGDKAMTLRARLTAARVNLFLMLLLVGAVAAGCVGDWIYG